MATISQTEKSKGLKYDPRNLLDTLIRELHIKNDASLSRILEVAPPVISKIRNKKLPIGPSILIRMHEASDLSIKELRELMGDHRDKFRIHDQLDSAEIEGKLQH